MTWFVEKGNLDYFITFSIVHRYRFSVLLAAKFSSFHSY